MHNLSFVEDPSRILRGIRLEQRLNMRFEDNTLRLLGNALQGELLGRLSGLRVRIELELSFKERRPEKVAARMQELNIWDALFPGLRFGSTASKKMKRLQRLLSAIRGRVGACGGAEWLAYLAITLTDVPAILQSLVMDRLNLAPSERRVVVNSLAALPQLRQFFSSKRAFPNSEVYLFLKNYSPVSLLYCWAAAEHRQTRRWIARHATFMMPLKGELTGRDLMKMGCSPGPWMGEMLEAVRLERMDGRIATREDEISYIREFMMRS
jgi:tRNA nucleotidyltransferase (CCA-adding enzyme)